MHGHENAPVTHLDTEAGPVDAFIVNRLLAAQRQRECLAEAGLDLMGQRFGQRHPGRVAAQVEEHAFATQNEYRKIGNRIRPEKQILLAELFFAGWDEIGDRRATAFRPYRGPTGQGLVGRAPLMPVGNRPLSAAVSLFRDRCRYCHVQAMPTGG